jgi:glycine hydroxymethyltransferase
MILCHPEFAKKIDSAVFPGLQGGPLMHVIAAKAVMFKEALEPEFKNYAAQVVKNAKAMALALEKKGYRIVSGGTDNHLFVVDLSPKGLTGKEAQEALDKSGINANRNTIPFDKQSPFVTSGVRLGSAAVTTRGMKESEMQEIADSIDQALLGRADASKLHQVHARVATMCNRFPIYAGERG